MLCDNKQPGKRINVVVYLPVKRRCYANLGHLFKGTKFECSISDPLLNAFIAPDSSLIGAPLLQDFLPPRCLLFHLRVYVASYLWRVVMALRLLEFFFFFFSHSFTFLDVDQFINLSGVIFSQSDEDLNWQLETSGVLERVSDPRSQVQCQGLCPLVCVVGKENYSLCYFCLLHNLRTKK